MPSGGIAFQDGAKPFPALRDGLTIVGTFGDDSRVLRGGLPFILTIRESDEGDPIPSRR